jgi:hypothetical protein
MGESNTVFNKHCMPNAKHWYHGFEWLRTFYIVCVLLMHQNFTQVMSGNKAEVTTYDFLKFNVLCLAIPGFLLMSSFLLVEHCHSWKVFWPKIRGNIALYLFWVGAWMLVTKSYPIFTMAGVVEYLLRGGGWAYYFFAVIIINSAIVALIHRFSLKSIIVCFIVSALMTQGTFHFLAEKKHAWMGFSTYWWPICFIPIPFLAVMLSRMRRLVIESNQYWWSAVVSAFVLFVGIAMIEWQFAAEAGLTPLRTFLPEYLRISLVFGAAFLLLVGLKINHSPWLVTCIGKNSLGIFCLHVFMIRTVAMKIQSQNENYLAASIATIAIVIGVCCLVSEVMRRLLKERII